MMLTLVLDYAPDKLRVLVERYGEDGGLVERREHHDVKQVVIDNCRVIVNRQLDENPVVLFLQAGEFEVFFSENGVLKIKGAR